MTNVRLDSLRVASYNCRGLNSGRPAVLDLLEICDFCFIQEHWLLHEQLHRLNVHDDFFSIGVSGMESSELHYGRPFGGCAIFYRKSLAPFVTRLTSPSKRFCSIKFMDHSGATFLLICIYMPFSDGSAQSTNDYLITLGELEGFITRHKYDHLLIAGDLNVDFDRSNSSLPHLLNFMSDFNLLAADLPHRSSIQYTYMRDDGSASSWLDHFLCDSSLASGLSQFRRFDFGSNLSDHCPLLCALSIALSPVCPSSSSSTSSHANPPRTAWYAVSPELSAAFCSLVSSSIPPFPVSIRDCCDPLCTHHHEFLDWYCEQISSCLHDAALSTLPKVHRPGPPWFRVGIPVPACSKRRPTSGIVFGVKLAALRQVFCTS